MTTHRVYDYYVVATRLGEPPERWGWEIRRRSLPLGIKIKEGGFQSRMAAEFAGKRALENFLLDLSQEEKRN